MRCGLSLRKSCFAAVVCFLLLMLSYPDPAWAGTFQYEIDEQNHYDSSNWMAGIADERYLHEINIPGAHDACAKHVWTLHNYTNTYYNYAITQCNTVTELLNSGVRMLDFRVTNCQRELIEVSKLGPKLNTLSKDSLFLSHGQYNGSIDALYYCIGENGLFIELNDALKDVHSWLLSHPTETVVIELKSEYDDSAVNTDLPNVYDTLKKKVDSCSWIYKDQEIPTLGDVRGRAVLASSRVDLLQRGLNVETDDKSGKRYVNGTDYYYENHYEYRPGPKKEEVKKFYQMYTARLSKEICSNVSDNPMYYVMSSSNVWQVLFGSNPRDIAEVVNPYLYNAANGLFKDRDGRKLGWVYDY